MRCKLTGIPLPLAGNCDSFPGIADCVQLSIATFMLKTKGHAEFDRWWNDWLSKIPRNRLVVEPQAPGKKPSGSVKRAAPARPEDSACEAVAVPKTPTRPQQ